MNIQKHHYQKQRRRSHRTRIHLHGTAQRPRLSVQRSLAHLRVQLIDDAAGRTLAAADDKGLEGKKSEIAFAVGKRIAEKAVAIGITAVIFDRGSYRYHGRVKATAEGARDGGLKF